MYELFPAPKSAVPIPKDVQLFKVSSKYVFVRILRNSVHLQRGTYVHWGCWLGSVSTIVALAFVVAEVIPIFSYVLSLVGSVCYAPLAIMLPGWLWLHDHGHYLRGSCYRIIIYCLHWLMLPLGGLFLVGATYGVVLQINEAYVNGDIGMLTSFPPLVLKRPFSVMRLSRWRLFMCR